MRAPIAFALCVLAVSTSAYATKVETVQKLIDGGSCAKAEQMVDGWEAKGALGAEEAELRKARADAAYCQAKAADTLAAWQSWLDRFPDWPQAAEVRRRIDELAFVAAQSEGTPAAMRAFIAGHPQSPDVDRARKQEEAWAFDDAAKLGTVPAIEAFLAEHPATTLRAQAWESLVQKSPGVYLIDPDGQPRALAAVPVEGDTLTMPAGVPSAAASPVVGVNLPGAGRGETSEWWRLQAVTYDAEGVARLGDTAPLGAELAARLGVAAPGPEAGLLTLVTAPGPHTARVVTTASPLGVVGHCDSFARFALVLRTPGGTTSAYPFSVSCPDQSAVTPVGLLHDVLDAAEAGDRPAARTAWATFAARSDAAELLRWLNTAFAGDPLGALVDRRPAVGDWIVWTTRPDGTLGSSWLRAEEGHAAVLAERPGWAVIAGGGLRTTIGDPACERLFGSIGATLFCAAGTEAHVVSFEGTPLPVPPPPAALLTANGFPSTLGPEAVVAVGPRWRSSQLVVAWRVRSGAQADIVGGAPEAWFTALGATPALGAWLAEHAGSSPFGAALVDRNVAALFAAFGAP